MPILVLGDTGDYTALRETALRETALRETALRDSRSGSPDEEHAALAHGRSSTA